MANDITVYTTPSWPACHQVKEYLSRKGVEYKAYDVASDTTARQEMATKTGSMAVPTLIINGQTVIGFDRTQIDQLLH